MTEKKSINVTVMIDEAHRRDIPAVAKSLAKKGFVLKETLEEIGVLSGTVDEGAISRLSGVTGVSAVEKDRDDYRTQR